MNPIDPFESSFVSKIIVRMISSLEIRNAFEEAFLKHYIVFLFVALTTVSCGLNGLTTSTPSSGGSGGYSWTGPIILSEINQQSNVAFAEIGTSSGAVTNAAVTLSYSGGTDVLNYFYSTSAPVTYSGGVTLVGVAYYYDTAYTYTANQPYTMTSVFGGTTYSAHLTSVGAPVFSTSGGGTTLVTTWSGGGNTNVIAAGQNVSPYTQKTWGPSVTSPYSIANSALPGAAGQNTVMATIITLNNAAYTGTSNGSYFLSTSQGATFSY